MKYIICFKLKRRNARRKELMRFDEENEVFAKNHFRYIVKTKGDINKMNYELLTGDWKHICFFDKEFLGKDE
ncbi:MAG: hypothetical protein J6T10_20490 [Methanobrevibacter sp.]|nr:hypothetical protein [Methanobrevibacter sp.]